MDLPEPPRRRLRGDGAAVVVRRRFVPGFIRLGTIDLFTPVWRELGQTLHDLHADTLVDAGRVGAHGLPQDLVDASDSVLLVCRTSLPSLAAARIYLSGLQEQAGDKLGLLVVGPGRPYTPQEVAEQFGVPVAAEIPWEPRGADEMFQGGALGSNWWGQRLATGYAAASARWGVPTEARPHPMEVGA